LRQFQWGDFANLTLTKLCDAGSYGAAINPFSFHQTRESLPRIVIVAPQAQRTRSQYDSYESVLTGLKRLGYCIIRVGKTMPTETLYDALASITLTKALQKHQPIQVGDLSSMQNSIVITFCAIHLRILQ
jgi:hypothetical protein